MSLYHKMRQISVPNSEALAKKCYNGFFCQKHIDYHWPIVTMDKEVCKAWQMILICFTHVGHNLVASKALLVIL